MRTVDMPEKFLKTSFPSRRLQNPPELLDALEELYTRVDVQSRILHLLHSNRLQCAYGCLMCCVDDLTVFVLEAENIRRRYATLLEQGKPHSHGACAFLNQNGGCRIYAHRPYVCRTQGLPLRWMEEAADGNVVELRDICPSNDRGKAIEDLSAEECWTIGPIEGKLAGLQAALDGGDLQRVSLRSLFSSNPDSEDESGVDFTLCKNT